MYKTNNIHMYHTENITDNIHIAMPVKTATCTHNWLTNRDVVAMSECYVTAIRG